MFFREKRFASYPKQFWFLLIGSLVFTTGASLVWPFLSIYLQAKLDIPLRYSSLLISIRAFSGVFASFFFAGIIADKVGRRFMMLLSLFGGILYYQGLMFSNTMWQFAILMAFWGMLDIFFPVGMNAMVADLIPGENRLEAYSLLRIVYNTGYGVGPILGGIMAAKSYSTIFIVASLGYAISFLFMFFFTKETLSEENRAINRNNHKREVAIAVVLKDRLFLASVFLMGLIYITSSGMFNILSFYAGNYLGIPENHISYVYTVNAFMCVFLQLGVIEKVKNQKPLTLMCYAGLLYFTGCIGVSLIDKVVWYCICMAVLTCGELIMTPTMSGLAARLAPADARGRYMSVLSLAQPFGQGIGPAFLGYLYDTGTPRFIWVYGSLFALISAFCFYILNKKAGNSDKLQSQYK